LGSTVLEPFSTTDVAATNLIHQMLQLESSGAATTKGAFSYVEEDDKRVSLTSKVDTVSAAVDTTDIVDGVCWDSFLDDEGFHMQLSQQLSLKVAEKLAATTTPIASASVRSLPWSPCIVPEPPASHARGNPKERWWSKRDSKAATKERRAEEVLAAVAKTEARAAPTAEMEDGTAAAALEIATEEWNCVVCKIDNNTALNRCTQCGNSTDTVTREREFELQMRIEGGGLAVLGHDYQRGWVEVNGERHPLGPDGRAAIPSAPENPWTLQEKKKNSVMLCSPKLGDKAPTTDKILQDNVFMRGGAWKQEKKKKKDPPPKKRRRLDVYTRSARDSAREKAQEKAREAASKPKKFWRQQQNHQQGGKRRQRQQLWQQRRLSTRLPQLQQWWQRQPP
jgi:hypothetical protein